MDVSDHSCYLIVSHLLRLLLQLFDLRLKFGV